MSAAGKAAKHAEIARRYRRRRGPYDRGAHRIAEISRLGAYRRRTGGTEIDVDAVVQAVRAAPRIWTAKAIGKCVALTWEERCRLSLRTIAPWDIGDAEFRRRKLMRKRELARVRQRRHRTRRQGTNREKRPREEAKMMTGGSNRVMAVLSRLSHGWTSVADLDHRLARARAFRGLRGPSRRRATNRTIDRLAKAGAVETRMERTHGFGKRLVRLVNATPHETVDHGVILPFPMRHRDLSRLSANARAIEIFLVSQRSVTPVCA